MTPEESGAEQRRYWVGIAEKVARPVLSALANGRLRETMPVETKFGDRDRADRFNCTHLEAVGRLLAGIAPWLELGPDDTPEGRLRSELAALAREGLDNATAHDSPDRLNFGAPRDGQRHESPQQPLVDAAFLAQALLRAPNSLWSPLSDTVKSNILAALSESRHIPPCQNNWLLFSAMVEAALASFGGDWDSMRVDYALRKHEDWYVGDGAYGDGPSYHWDYYNSFVIQPMILDILRTCDAANSGRFGIKWETALARAKRYAAVQERLISPEGTLPPIGRSLTYRMGALQVLGQMALFDELPDDLHPAQLRCAMTAVIRRLMEALGTFDDAGWLRIGFCGSQPGLGEPYISTGSLYLCAVGLLPLGLPASNVFWTGPATPWTSQRIYRGADLPADHAI